MLHEIFFYIWSFCFKLVLKKRCSFAVSTSTMSFFCTLKRVISSHSNRILLILRLQFQYNSYPSSLCCFCARLSTCQYDFTEIIFILMVLFSYEWENRKKLNSAIDPVISWIDDSFHAVFSTDHGICFWIHMT